MITVAEAKDIVRQHCKPLPPVEMPLENALDKVLAQDVLSPIDLPSFRQSSMDGYAFCHADRKADQPMPLQGEMQAGSTVPSILESGTAMRIFTGAPLPDGADTVIMQEHTRTVNGQLFLEPTNSLEVGTNVRLQGMEIKKGGLALPAGTALTPTAIGYLAGLGITQVLVHESPRVAIVTTGKELLRGGMPLGFGQVYESNSIGLKMALAKLQINDVTVFYADDHLEELTDTIKEAIDRSDLLLLTGGVSVGDYDYVVQALEGCGVERHFHKIKQKPGKPLYFGTLGSKVVFGLPGNPASSMVCFYQYVTVALQQMKACGKKSGSEMRLPITHDFKKPAGLTHFLKAQYDGNGVTLASAQESFRLAAFATANGLVEVQEETTTIQSGDLVIVHTLD